MTPEEIAAGQRDGGCQGRDMSPSSAPLTGGWVGPLRDGEENSGPAALDTTQAGEASSARRSSLWSADVSEVGRRLRHRNTMQHDDADGTAGNRARPLGSDTAQAGSPASLALRPVARLGLKPDHGVYLWTEATFLEALARAGITVTRGFGGRPVYWPRPGWGTEGCYRHEWAAMSWDARYDYLVGQQSRADAEIAGMTREALEDEARERAEHLDAMRQPTAMDRWRAAHAPKLLPEKASGGGGA